MNITIVDYKSGNISSVINSFNEVAKNKAKTVDDVPFGGGAGMLLRPDILQKSLEY